jgi:hypothetical protein
MKDDLPAPPPAAEPCPGQLTWSAFGAPYPDTVCSSALTWPDGEGPGDGVLCDADDDFRSRDVPCPFCNPEGFIGWAWGGREEMDARWYFDGTDGGPVPADVPISFHDGKDLMWSADHPVRGRIWVLARDTGGPAV